jgi:glycosyltransferase involved in cell wall biosynthesis
MRSVLAQTSQDWELIIVNDGPADDTERVVRGFKDSRIHYLQHQTNRGGSAARNTGICTARGDYVAFLHSDDEWVPTKLQKQLAFFRSIGDGVTVVRRLHVG